MRKLKISDHWIDFFNKSCRPPRRARTVLCGIARRPTAIAAPAIATAVNTSPSPMTPDRRAGTQTRIKLGTTDEREGARRWMAVDWRSPAKAGPRAMERSAEHTSELQSLMSISYAVFCLNKNIQQDPT